MTPVTSQSMDISATADVSYTDTIDLSTTMSGGTGYTVTGVSYPYDPRFLEENPTGALTFTAAANGKSYHIIQSGVPNNPSSKGPKYGTSKFFAIAIPAGVDVTLAVSTIDLIGSISLSGDGKLNLLLDGTNYVRSRIAVPSTAEAVFDSLNEDDTSDRLIIPSAVSSAGASASIGGVSGGGNTSGGAGGTITINGATLDITTYSTGAGIGGAGAGGTEGASPGTSGGSGGAITINGGKVSVVQYGGGSSGNGAGIGGAGIGGGGGSGVNGGDGGTIKITGGTVSVIQYTRGAGIGGGTYGTAGDITIDGGNIDVQTIDRSGRNNGACIGSATGTNAPGVGSVTINGGTVNVVGAFTGIGRVHGNSNPSLSITITGGIVNAKGENGPGIGYWDASFGDTITLTGGTIIAASDTQAGIGRDADTNFSLDVKANVWAYSGNTNGTYAAVSAKSNSGNGHFVNARLTSGALSSTASTTLKVHASSGAALLNTLTLPAKYPCFAYSTGTTTKRVDHIYAYNSSTYLGGIVRTSDSNADIYSRIALDDYNDHNSNARNGVLPVKFDANTDFTGSNRYIVTRDSDGYYVGSRYYLSDAIALCRTDGPYTITATENDLDVNALDHASAVIFTANKKITLTSDAGGPYTLWQTQKRRHFDILSELTMTNIILDVSTTGGGISVRNILNLKDGAVIQNCVDDQSLGACIYLYKDTSTSGVLNMQGGEIKNNRTSGSGTTNGGGGVYVPAGTTFTMSGGVISGNAASTTGTGLGGGVYVDGGTANLKGGMISGNTANASGRGYGGGVYIASGVLTVDGATISGNTARTGTAAGDGAGGGVYIAGGTVTMKSGTISGNTANAGNLPTSDTPTPTYIMGGGVYLSSGCAFNLSGGKISDNIANKGTGRSANGGGAWVAAGAAFTVTGSAEISGNKALDGEGGGIFAADYDYADPVAASSYQSIGIVASAVVKDNVSSVTRIRPSNASIFANRTTRPFDGNLLDNDTINYNNTDYRILYKANGGTGADYFQKSPTPLTTTATQAMANFGAPTAMFFKSWNTKADGGGVSYAENEAITLSGGITLYAQWAPVLTTLTISKAVTGDYGDKTKDFIFTVFFKDSTDTTLAAGTSFEYTGGIILSSGAVAPLDGTRVLDDEGKAVFALKHGQTITLQGIAATYKIRIVESSDASYTTFYADSEAGTNSLIGSDTEWRNMTPAARTFGFVNARISVPEAGFNISSRALWPLFGVTAPLALAGLAYLFIRTGRRYQKGKVS